MLEVFKDKKILVAGGAGFIGTNLMKQFIAIGNNNIRATIHKKRPVIINENIKYVQCDLTKRADCQKVVEDIDYVFMCAANTSGAAIMEKTPLAHVTPNVLMNVLMLDAAYRSKVKKFLFISSNTVYPITDYPVKEDEMMSGDLFKKYFCVGWMKRFTEILCQMYTVKIENPMKTVVVRPANIYGPYDDFKWETSHVVPALIRKVVERHKPIEVWGDGKDIKDLIYVDDFIKGMLLAMEKIETYDPVNIGTGKPRSIEDVLQTILTVANYANAEIIFNPSKPTMIPKRLVDVSKAKRLLGFKAKTSFADGIKKTIEWYLSKHAKN